MKVSSLYPEVVKWLNRYLKDRHSRCEVEVYDTRKINLSDIILKNNIYKFFPAYDTFKFKINITAFIKSEKAVKLVFLECKLKPMTLKDIGPLLGYSMIAKPEYSLLISPEGLSDSLSTLLRTFGRYDILEYDRGKRIRIAQWNADRKEIDSSTLLPPGEFIHPK